MAKKNFPDVIQLLACQVLHLKRRFINAIGPFMQLYNTAKLRKVKYTLPLPNFANNLAVI